ncbi:MAG: PmoA family protein, partial [Planctomycetaceae bacterium]|nr:PmoA family protein [Planctomycetaceae bacterium]
QWQTVYDLLDEQGNALFRESQIWTLQDFDDWYALDLEWTGEALTDVTIGKHEHSGLFLRVPRNTGASGAVVNSVRQVGERANGQRAVWVDVGMHVEGRDDLAHIAIFDHPQNKDFPQPWIVGEQMGVGAARSRMGDWTLATGDKALVRHRFVIHTGELRDVELTRRWCDYSGQPMAYAEWLTAREEGKRAEFLSPQQAADAMTLADGVRVNVYAGEPMIAQPMAFCWDARGRMWVAENLDYETRQKGFSANGHSRIVILDDTDGDGVADSRKVFLEGIPFPSGIAVGHGGLWLGAPPNLLFVPDRDGNDEADMDDIEVRLTGWGIRDRHETLNSFYWGPDGWLYGCNGFATPCKVGKPAGKGRIFKHNDPFPETIEYEGEPVDLNGAIWKYHPIKDRFEVILHGLSNPWGLDYDAHGQFFCTACVIPHLWHVIPGGLYHRQGGTHFNPYVYSDIRTIAEHEHRSAHGGARIYLSDAFPEKYRDRIFMANIHEHAVLTDILEPRGSGFVGRHGDDFALANNAAWIGFSVEIGPQGDVYVLDWHDGDICGMDVLNKDTGRIFRFSPETSHAQDFPHRQADLNTLSDGELVALQTVESAWHARHARTILQHRATQASINASAIARLQELRDGTAPTPLRLNALWTLHVINAQPPAKLIELLSDSEPYLRAWAIQLLCEDLAPPDAALQQFARMADNDPSPVVRLYLAAALQRVPRESVWTIAERLSLVAEDAEDHNIPKMIWFGLGGEVPRDSDRALRLASSARMPLLSRQIARRLVDDNQLDAVVTAAAQAGAAQRDMLLGIRDGLEGRFDVSAPTSWPQVYEQLRAAGGENARIALQLSQQFSDTVAAETLLKTLQDEAASLPDRLDALRGLAGRKRPELKPILLAMLSDENLQTHAIRATAAFDDGNLADALLERYDELSVENKLEAVQALAARSDSGRKLTEAIRDGRVPRPDVPAWIARQLQRVVGNGFLEVWGALEGVEADKEALFIKYRTLFNDDVLQKADAAQGRAIFNRTCAACHKLHGHGGVLGPDITGANRGNLEYLLGNILTPSAVIQDAYRMHIIVTHDGRVWSGIPAEENERQLRLRVANQEQPVIINKSEIESHDIAPVSIMPEGQLTT